MDMDTAAPPIAAMPFHNSKYLPRNSGFEIKTAIQQDKKNMTNHPADLRFFLFGRVPLNLYSVYFSNNIEMVGLSSRYSFPATSLNTPHTLKPTAAVSFIKLSTEK